MWCLSIAIHNDHNYSRTNCPILMKLHTISYYTVVSTMTCASCKIISLILNQPKETMHIRSPSHHSLMITKSIKQYTFISNEQWETLFHECYNQQKRYMDKGRTTTNIQKTTTQTRQYKSTKQDTNSTRVPTIISLKLRLIQVRLGTYICQKDRLVLKTF